jgi:hypothetical protein
MLLHATRGRMDLRGETLERKDPHAAGGDFINAWNGNKGLVEMIGLRSEVGIRMMDIWVLLV